MLRRSSPAARNAALAPVIAAFLAAGALHSAAANQITSLSRGYDAEGCTIITATFDEPVSRELVRRFDIADPPRAAVAIEGIHRSLDPGELFIGDAHVVRVRLVHHADRTPPELLVVMDLTGPESEISDLRVDGSRVEIAVGSRTTAPTPPPSPTSPSPTPTPQATGAPEPTPTTTPTATPPASISPPPTPTAAPPPTATFEPSPTPSPTPSSTATPSSALPPPIATPATVQKAASRIEEITLSNRSDGATLLLVSANGRLPRGCARHMNIAGTEPAIVVTLRGLSAPDLSRTLTFDDRNIHRIRLVHDAGTTEGELHLLITPTSDTVEVRRFETAGSNLVVLLQGGSDR